MRLNVIDSWGKHYALRKHYSQFLVTEYEKLNTISRKSRRPPYNLLIYTGVRFTLTYKYL